MNRPDSARPKSNRKFSILPKTAAVSSVSRPVTQQGLSGVRPSQSPSTGQTRIHKDKRYYFSLMQIREREIREEISALKKQTDECKSLNAKQEEYKKVAERLAKECNESQEVLNIYNTVLSTHLSRTNDEDILIETAAYRRKNEELSKTVDDIIGKKLALNETLNKLESEVNEIKKLREKEIEKLSPEDRLKYETLAKENDTYLQTLSDLKVKLSKVQERLSSAEETLTEGKKNKIRLLEEKQQHQDQIASLERDIDNAESPETMQSKLLTQVKNDKADIETLKKVLDNLEAELRGKQDYLLEIDNEMNSKNKDRLKKLKDLRERGEEMKKFIEECEQTMPELKEKIRDANEKVELAMEHSSISTVDLKSFSEDFDETKFVGNEENLSDMYETLKLKYARVVKIDNTYKQELENTRKLSEELKTEMDKYQDVELLREQLFEKKSTAEERCFELEQTLKTTEEVIENARLESEALKTKLDQNKLYEEIKRIEQDIEECNDEVSLIRSKIESAEGVAHHVDLLGEVDRLMEAINGKIIKELSAH